MARADFINILYSKNQSPLEFHFDNLIANFIYSYLSVTDIIDLNKIATSVKLSSKPKEKYKLIDQILRRRHFRKYASGTNRVVYRYLDDNSIVLKVAIDSIGIKDNPNEYRNQFLLKPFITKCFEVSQCGTVGLFEKVEPILKKEEFASIAPDIFDLLNNHIIGKYVLEDIGTKYFMNYGIRKGFGPVLLDFPYVYELDGNKLYCNQEDLTTSSGYCEGLIDYDNGFNNLVCEKCGKRFLATELKKYHKDNKIIIKDEGEVNMKFAVTRGDNVVDKINTGNSPTKTYKKPQNNKSTKELNVESKKSSVVVSESKTFIVPSLEPQTYDKDKFNRKTSLDDTPKVDSLYRSNESESITEDDKFLDENGNLKSNLSTCNTGIIKEDLKIIPRKEEITNVMDEY